MTAEILMKEGPVDVAKKKNNVSLAADPRIHAVSVNLMRNGGMSQRPKKKCP